MARITDPSSGVRVVADVFVARRASWSWRHYAAVVALLLGTDATAQTPALLARLEEGRWVAFVEPTTGASRRVYEIQRRAAWNLTVAPDEGHVALIETGTGAPRSYSNELVVLDTSGKPAHRIPRDVQRYVWCGGTCVAYIEGAFREGGIGFTPTGAFLFDITTGEERPLPGPSYPYDIRWASFDSSLYLKNAGREDGFGIFRYHLTSGTLSRTSYRDFDFSPSGKYYIEWAGEGHDRTRLFDRASNREVPLPDSASIGVPSRWVFTNGNFLLLVRLGRPDSAATRPPRARAKVVFDVSARRVIQRLEGDIQPWSAAPGVLAIVQHGRLNVLWRPRP